MLQIVMQVPAASRITSYSISRHPASDRSTSTWPIGETARPLLTTSTNCSSVAQSPPPVPPRVKAGLTTRGNPVASRNRRAPARESTVRESGTGSPMRWSSSLNFSRSSAVRIASREVPRGRTPYFSRTPASSSAMARLSPV